MNLGHSCKIIRPSKNYQGKQGLDYEEAISAETAGAEGICMQLLTIPPGVRGKTHMHENHETAIYIMEGIAAMWYGDKLRQHMELEPGDFFYIPAGMPHLPYNPSKSETCKALIARTDPNEQESVLLQPDLDEMWKKIQP